MKLIHIPGVSCYLDCIITLANAFQIDYTASFSCLWSETELSYETICHTFLSRRLPRMLEMMGMRLEEPCVSAQDRARGWADVSEGEFGLVGMDGFLLPWNPLYGVLHGPHYFIAQKRGKEPQCCFDPTYGLRGQKMRSEELVSSSFAVIPVTRYVPDRRAEGRKDDLLLSQAAEVARTHPGKARRFLSQAKAWMQGPEQDILLPAKFTEALTEGRCLYGYFLRQQETDPKRASLFWSDGYFKEWRAVKNGFYKAALLKGNGEAFHEACRLFMAVFKQELDLAEDILTAGDRDKGRAV